MDYDDGQVFAHYPYEQIKESGHTVRHTPGPWTVAEDTDRLPAHCNWRVVAPGSTENHIKPIASLYLQGENAEANAHLIAAAPEMLEALKSMLAWADPTLPIDWRKPYPASAAKAAITKAEGQK